MILKLCHLEAPDSFLRVAGAPPLVAGDPCVAGFPPSVEPDESESGGHAEDFTADEVVQP